jgi:Haem-NO-binding
LHGTIFNYLKHFADDEVGSDAWAKMLKSAGLEGHVYSMDVTYADAELVALVEAASSATNVPGPELLGRFGEWLVPDLLSAYSYLIRPEWGVMDVLVNTERMIHQAVRMGNPGATPPRLSAKRISSNEVRIVYSSARRMCLLGEGIIRGLGVHYGTPVEAAQSNCMLRGDPYCEIVARTGGVK